MGIDIITHSSILDVVFSPIVSLVNNPVIFAVFFLLTYWIVIQPRFHKKNREKSWYRRLYDVEKRDKRFAKQEPLPRETPILAIAFASFLVGTSIGDGLELKQEIAGGEVKAIDTLTYLDGEEKTVHIIGQNSLYISSWKKEKRRGKRSSLNTSSSF